MQVFTVKKTFYLGRLIHLNNILPGKYQPFDEKLHSVLNGDSHKDGDKEIIQVNPGCPVFWAPFTVGSGFPDETVKGGYLADSSTDLYVIRAVQGDFTMFGYYNPVTAIGYVEHWGVKEVTHMELLLFLIWMFPVCTKIGHFYYRQECCILFGLPFHSQQETLYIKEETHSYSHG